MKRYQAVNVSRFKARVVAGKNLQREGLDFNTVYAPVVDFTYTLLILLDSLSDS